jgi:hypothetical protein
LDVTDLKYENYALLGSDAKGNGNDLTDVSVQLIFPILRVQESKKVAVLSYFEAEV